MSSKIKRIEEILDMQENHTCLHCECQLSPRRQCYNCNNFVYDAEYFSAIRKIINEPRKR